MLKKKSQAPLALLCLLPALIILTVFQIYPSLKVFIMSSYTKFNYLRHEVHEYGIGNFVTLFRDPNFVKALRNTLLLVLTVVPVSILFSLLIALSLAQNTRIRNLVRGIYFLPFVTSTVAVSAVWRWIFHSKYGLLNYFLGLFGGRPIKWLSDPRWSFIALAILCVWKSLGYNILILVTGLRNIDEKYIQAARVDGASAFAIKRSIILPLLTPSLFLVSVTSLISSFKTFQEVYALFHKTPGPLKSCLTMVYYIYDNISNKYLFGLASAASVVLFLIVLGVTVLQLRVGKRFVHYH